MKVSINKISHELPAGATLADAIARVEARPPFAAAVNMKFVPNTQYKQTPLAADDRIDIISPVTGG
ncbi:MAG: sulfur carrier protein ThiS [Gammaproteobacteria bacterium]|jgi:sulfur carrier protein|nr:sulfur carrier protein ThiS [Gammaproteobacteria bacterium]MBU0786429.1 sulfur carrier protein ThiS [Gammaproteobacteria bacterium]MBU0816132.1 sulfur carrier protein ThiS [Gammaproteobacteria bacterium]MBU1787842.1 sulfur carrier protein ThiS [Gammaproteobacteria bacterium]